MPEYEKICRSAVIDVRDGGLHWNGVVLCESGTRPLGVIVVNNGFKSGQTAVWYARAERRETEGWDWT